MSETTNPFYEVQQWGGKYQVVLMEDEYYRDPPGNLRKRRIATRRYESFDLPMDAQRLASVWNGIDSHTKE